MRLESERVLISQTVFATRLTDSGRRHRNIIRGGVDHCTVPVSCLQHVKAAAGVKTSEVLEGLPSRPRDLSSCRN